MQESYAYLRNRPRQKRSLERFEHILDTANTLFAQHGYDSVTTNHIAEAAGIAIGSVYHFFPNKETILYSLVNRCGTRLMAVFPSEIAPPRAISDILTSMLEQIIDFQQGQLGFDWMLTSTESSRYQGFMQELHGRIIAWVEDLLAAQIPELLPTQRRTCATAGVALIQGLMPLMHPPYEWSEEQFKQEAHCALLGYLRAVLQRLELTREI